MSAIPDDIENAVYPIAVDIISVVDGGTTEACINGAQEILARALYAERLSEHQRSDDLIEEVKRVLRPFNQMAGELFSRNWNASDLVLALDNPGQENHLTAGDIFAVRALLSKLEERAENALTPAEQFAKWLDEGPKLAKAAGCYVGITVSDYRAALNEEVRK